MRRIVKVGGSLLGRGDFPDRFRDWYDRQPMAETLIVVGGGAVVDAIRQYDALRPGDPESIHWLCVDLLDATFQLVRSWLDWPAILAPHQLQQGVATTFSVDRPTLVAVRSFYHRDAGELAHRLPADWQTTTDSIAALLAVIANADEIVLLKSCRIDPAMNLGELAERGIVDRAFPAIAREVTAVRLEQL
jgi:aspartokinase-like uncharacterized kinase